MKKIAFLLLCVAFMFSLCACSASNPNLQQVRECWDRIGDSDIEVDEIYIMKYTSRTQLSDEVLETSMYETIPSRGYVILFHSFSSEAFMDSYACFLDEDRNLRLTFDYEETHKLYEAYYAQFSVYNIEAGEQALELLSDCNYISGMINDASGEAPGFNIEKNVWYSLSKDQIQWVTAS